VEISPALRLGDDPAREHGRQDDALGPGMVGLDGTSGRPLSEPKIVESEAGDPNTGLLITAESARVEHASCSLTAAHRSVGSDTAWAVRVVNSLVDRVG
jgi:hypothetical protein